MSRGSHRESLTPMDFVYDNDHGPVDPRSPFVTSVANPSARKRELDPSAPSPFRVQGTPQLSKGPLFSQTGRSQLESPTKNAFTTPSRLRETAANFPQSGSRPLNSIPQHVSNAWTPRTPAADYDFSSGGETPNTPAQDSEQPTPDTHMAGKMRLLMDSPSPKKQGRRQSFFKALKNFGSPSPTKELKEIEKEVSRKHYNEKLENRVAKRRSTRDRTDRSKRKRVASRDDNDDESDGDVALAQKDTTTELSTAKQTYGASIAGFFHWIEAHPRLPSVLSVYMQFILNVSLVCSFIFVMYWAFNAVAADINIESTKHQSEIMVEIAQCVKNYRENRCEPETRVPAMEMACGNWETCMSRDPQKLARASVTVKTFANIINGFFDAFSYKSLISIAILIFGGFNLSNYAFSFLRHQQQPQPQPQQQPYADFAAPPQTPHRANTTAFLESGQQAWPTPYQTPYEPRGFAPPPALQHTQSTPALPSYAFEGAAEEAKTPSRRRGFR
ncbi:hypothetical protein E8E13_004199 [Curvularia kusanoi]|uniref:Brl1/Brr6 domain-containing protein n=1 Tax=Curvularia kusanoi TaxID=90978 RepID=A0A9P4TKS0_CURKU|nr:hypothetical protein E8E13_004199 [Curvularia kusanoi]